MSRSLISKSFFKRRYRDAAEGEFGFWTNQTFRWYNSPRTTPNSSTSEKPNAIWLKKVYKKGWGLKAYLPDQVDMTHNDSFIVEGCNFDGDFISVSTILALVALRTVGAVPAHFRILRFKNQFAPAVINF